MTTTARRGTKGTREMREMTTTARRGTKGTREIREMTTTTTTARRGTKGMREMREMTTTARRGTKGTKEMREMTTTARRGMREMKGNKSRLFSLKGKEAIKEGDGGSVRQGSQLLITARMSLRTTSCCWIEFDPDNCAIASMLVQAFYSRGCVCW
jgi:hypothetical protein